MQGQNPSRRRILPELSQLHKEVRKLSQCVRSQALIQAQCGNTDYLEIVKALIDERIRRGDARERVTSLASATEFGLFLHHQDELCRQAAEDSGSEALMVLYWTVIRRAHKAHQGSSARAKNSSSSARKATVSIAANPPPDPVIEAALSNPVFSKRAPCRSCEELRLDSRRADGHEALLPISGIYLRCASAGVLTEVRKHRCRNCETIWTQHKSRANPFMSWSINKKCA